MYVAGAPLWKILAAGEWRSPAFLEYMDMNRLENDVVVQVSQLLPGGHARVQLRRFAFQAHADESGTDSD